MHMTVQYKNEPAHLSQVETVEDFDNQKGDCSPDVEMVLYSSTGMEVRRTFGTWMAVQQTL